MNLRSSLVRWPTTVCALLVAGCGGAPPPIPQTAAIRASTPEAQAVFDACLRAHGGAAAYGRLHDVNVRFDSHWATVGPALQPVLSDRSHRGGSEERYLPVKGGFIVGQLHHGLAGAKHVFHASPRQTTVAFRPPTETDAAHPGAGFTPSSDPEVVASAGLVTDAYAMFLFGPEFFRRRGAKFQKLPATAQVDGRSCDELLTVIRPGLGGSDEDRVILFIDHQDHLLRRVQFTLNVLATTRGAEVHVDLSDHWMIDYVMWPRKFRERIDRPVNLPAHDWSLISWEPNRGYTADDLAAPGFKGKAVAPAGDIYEE